MSITFFGRDDGIFILYVSSVSELLQNYMYMPDVWLVHIGFRGPSTIWLFATTWLS
jgi:hypothetical protein